MLHLVIVFLDQVLSARFSTRDRSLDMLWGSELASVSAYLIQSRFTFDQRNERATVTRHEVAMRHHKQVLRLDVSMEQVLALMQIRDVADTQEQCLRELIRIFDH